MCALWLLGGAARAEDVEGSRDETQDAPLLAKRSQTPAAEVPAGPHELIVFRGTLLFNEYVYRAILQLPADAKATHETARKIAGAIALFLRDAGYELATVRAQVVGDQIEVQVDEGQLDKIILANAGAVTTVRFKLELNLPRDVFNRRELERQLPILARRFHLRSYAYELWPAQRPLFDDEGPQLGDVEELRAVPLFRGGRAYELRILADPDPWGEGFGPEVVINGRVGVEAG
ncbi:MAG: hypothetical protein JST92_21845, partial [Deltaproteobacteria bacterium]|nr:hypothetical protein [Deltaproteobacteria bacterium]